MHETIDYLINKLNFKRPSLKRFIFLTSLGTICMVIVYCTCRYARVSKIYREKIVGYYAWRFQDLVNLIHYYNCNHLNSIEYRDTITFTTTNVALHLARKFVYKRGTSFASTGQLLKFIQQQTTSTTTTTTTTS
jgi:hypothetical protein